jgi:hypothetical protein
LAIQSILAGASVPRLDLVDQLCNTIKPLGELSVVALNTEGLQFFSRHKQLD